MGKAKDLDDAVLEVIKSGQIGRPVFVRCMIGVPEERDEQVNLFLDITMTVQAWIGDSVQRLYALGTWGPTLSLHLVFRNGASALISGQVTGRWIADLIVVGNTGAMYRDAYWGGFALLNRAFPESATKRAIRGALEAAVQSGKPQSVT
jgi:hypothetical protein